eukprot:SAG11_NODE_28675_length_319_cov_0.695455_2_plen_48_part_01
MPASCINCHNLPTRGFACQQDLVLSDSVISRTLNAYAAPCARRLQLLR